MRFTTPAIGVRIVCRAELRSDSSRLAREQAPSVPNEAPSPARWSRQPGAFRPQIVGPYSSMRSENSRSNFSQKHTRSSGAAIRAVGQLSIYPG